jgi:hypothetical protein
MDVKSKIDRRIAVSRTSALMEWNTARRWCKFGGVDDVAFPETSAGVSQEPIEMKSN